MNATNSIKIPEILAPAGSVDSFMAAIVAQADAIYCGLKKFSARKDAGHFTIETLSRLIQLAHTHGIRVYVALNAMTTDDELEEVGQTIDELNRYAHPDALIIQDLGVLALSKAIGFKGEIHLSTLAHVSTSSYLKGYSDKFKVDRIVLPRELTIDEIKMMADVCPQNLGLEVFVHGALCYGVSGRCYWSSYLGGKSGLRGFCVQPCRRIYDYKGMRGAFFSCADLGLDVLVKALLPVPEVKAWKIEGRKKGAHYVFQTVTAYRILRDLMLDPVKKSENKKYALYLLSTALGRPTTHYNFLPQRPQMPINIKSHTGSGSFIGEVKGEKGNTFFNPRISLNYGDLIRFGTEEDKNHCLYTLKQSVPKNGKFYTKGLLKTTISKGSGVFLLDRRGVELKREIAGLLATMKKQSQIQAVASSYQLPNQKHKSVISHKLIDLTVYRQLKARDGITFPVGLWISPSVIKKIPKNLIPKIWWWLPPVIWPRDESNQKEFISKLLKMGAQFFVANAIGQIELFSSRLNSGYNKVQIWAGPFCNISNYFAISMVKSMEYDGCIVSPELDQNQVLNLPQKSPLPLGVFYAGHWPVSISRVAAPELKTETKLMSPKKEIFYLKKYQEGYWIFPNWQLNLMMEKKQLIKAGYQILVRLMEPLPPSIKLKDRPGMWNWKIGIK